MARIELNFIKAEKQLAQELQHQIKEKEEFNERLKEAKDDFDDIINGDEPFSYEDIEEMMLEHGLEMDYVEDFLL